MKCSLGISNFLEEISSFSHSIVFLCLFALISEEVFLISPCNSLELCIQMSISFLFSFAFHFSSFHIYLRLPQTAILLFCISFSRGWSWFLFPVQCHEPPFIVHHALCLSDLGHGGEVWQNVVHWKREWQTTSVFFTWEPYEQYEKAKRKILKEELPRR